MLCVSDMLMSLHRLGWIGYIQPNQFEVRGLTRSLSILTSLEAKQVIKLFLHVLSSRALIVTFSQVHVSICLNIWKSYSKPHLTITTLYVFFSIYSDVYEQLVDQGVIEIKPEVPPPTVPMDYNWARVSGFVILGKDCPDRVQENRVWQFGSKWGTVMLLNHLQ